MKLRSLKFACAGMFALSIAANAQVRSMEKVRFLALGDSYTIGQSVSTNERWPVQLIDSLRARGFACYDPTIIATTGWRTDNLSDAIEGSILRHDYNLVSLLIGVNNQYQGRTAESYAPEFYSLLDKAISLAGGNLNHVFVVSIPDYGFTPFGKGSQSYITAGINAFNNVNKSISEARGITYIDITEISRQGLDKPELVASDGLHPSGKMYTEWVKLILDNLIVENVVTNTDQKETKAITLFPNPGSSSITIDNLPATAKEYKLTLRDTTGKVIAQKVLTATDHKAVLDISTLSNGVYFYELAEKGVKLKSGKFVKH
ncbi:MAG TPA: GDSL-type esterase/lipase family protein [Cyclobacteriaceae bacterium]|nr:T9SS type A sorting domain-containing protein [Cyclobacteriaceae bacterium]HMV09518.1 GDSL-type esterase/lipase family protein [Cyclobacteriaceae bacterium]HMX02019.1 GDSL-type esterase/lipase family protein [Cyclobacteriaceae bacterium]HMX51888.1 GDSL-type esterase/lipase family protein [Cyclobacteriaceae bacterium]HMY94842.1 GDSL-type esterase/lipase family protein [Cyclobacteriaceae bacterium]